MIYLKKITVCQFQTTNYVMNGRDDHMKPHILPEEKTIGYKSYYIVITLLPLQIVAHIDEIHTKLCNIILTKDIVGSQMK